MHSLGFIMFVNISLRPQTLYVSFIGSAQKKKYIDDDGYYYYYYYYYYYDHNHNNNIDNDKFI